MKNTFYRLDEYPSAIGNLIGFYSSLTDAIWTMESDGPTMKADKEPTGYPYFQITEFTTDKERPDLEAWENSEILHDYFFTPAEAVRIM